jgi:D-serine deaminase-like pyridoxal phosphate-dependent protein
MDVDYLETGGLPYKSALTVIATVISHSTPDRAIIDAGLKTLSDDSGPARVVDALGWSYHHAGDEHGTLTLTTSAARRELVIGDRVTLVPSHIDTTINLHDVIHVQRNRQVQEEWPVAARGRVQ